MADTCEVCGRVGHTFKLVRLHRAPFGSVADIQRAIRDEARVWICGPDCKVRGDLLLCERERRSAPPPQPRRDLHDTGRADQRGLEVGELEHDPRAPE